MAKRRREELTPKQQRFVTEYMLDLNATQAAIRAGYSAKTADRIGPELLGKTCVQQAIQKAQHAREQRTQIKTDDVLRHWWLVATADPNDLIEFRRTCCRCCYGEGFRRQRTQLEMDRDEAAHRAALAEAARDPASQPVPPFDREGGVGYDPRRPPCQECQECFGEGVAHVYPKDTRNLSEAARRLYAGVKQSKGGFEIKMHDQAAALVNVAKHLGMLSDRPDGAPPPTDGTAANDPNVLAAAVAGLLARLGIASPVPHGGGQASPDGPPVG